MVVNGSWLFLNVFFVAFLTFFLGLDRFVGS